MSAGFRIAAATAAAIASLSGFNMEAVMAKNEPKADVRGTITSISLNSANPAQGSIRVEGKLEPGTSVDAAAIRVNDKTRLEKVSGGKRVSAKLAEFKVGMKVEAGFVGPVAESYPVQAQGGWILLLESSAKK